jgi:hypothetical protein
VNDNQNSKEAAMTEEARISGLYTEDPILGPQVMAARPNVIATRTIGKRHEVFFHDNPAHSNVPSGRELRALLNDVEIEEYQPPVQGEAHAEAGEDEGEAQEGDAEKSPSKKGSSGKASRKR